jgi:hypothetical protein
LQVTGAGFDDNARVVTMVPHALEHPWSAMIEIEQNISGILIPAIGVKIDVEAFPIAHAQETEVGLSQQVDGGPQSFSVERPAALMVD